MTKKIRRWLIGVLALCSVAAGGITLAFMFQRAEKTNRFISAQVSCAVHERLDGAEVDGNTAQGGEKSDIRVENTGNIKAFLRIRLVSYYVDADGNISGTVSSVFPTPALRNGWIAGPNHTYYYPHPVEPGGMTGILCEPIALEQTELADGTPLYQVLQVFAEAIQAETASAAGEAWGVTLTNNEITTVS